jgi:hypothetical protein
LAVLHPFSAFPRDRGVFNADDLGGDGDVGVVGVSMPAVTAMSALIFDVWVSLFPTFYLLSVRYRTIDPVTVRYRTRNKIANSLLLP